MAGGVHDCVSIVEVDLEELSERPLPSLFAYELERRDNDLALGAEGPRSYRIIFFIIRRFLFVWPIIAIALFFQTGCRYWIIHPLHGDIDTTIIVNEAKTVVDNGLFATTYVRMCIVRHHLTISSRKIQDLLHSPWILALERKIEAAVNDSIEMC